MKLVIGCDPNAAELKLKLMKVCKDLQHEVIDFGSNDTVYANTAIQVAEYVAAKHADRGILICGTGIGMCIAANKVQGAYAAVISDIYSAERAVKSNCSNIACLGAFTIGEKLAEKLLKTWLDSEFREGCASQIKVNRYVEYDKERKGWTEGLLE